MWLVSQQAMIKAVLGGPRFVHTRELYQELKGLTIDQVFTWAGKDLAGKNCRGKDQRGKDRRGKDRTRFTYMVALYFKKSIASDIIEEFCIRTH